MWMYDAVENNGKYTRWEALGQLVTALSLLAGLYGLSMLYDAPSRNPAVRICTMLKQHVASYDFSRLCRSVRSTLLTTSTWSAGETQTEHRLRQTGRRRSTTPTAASPHNQPALPWDPPTLHLHCTCSGHAMHMYPIKQL